MNLFFDFLCDLRGPPRLRVKTAPPQRETRCPKTAIAATDSRNRVGAEDRGDRREELWPAPLPVPAKTFSSPAVCYYGTRMSHFTRRTFLAGSGVAATPLSAAAEPPSRKRDLLSSA